MSSLILSAQQPASISGRVVDMSGKPVSRMNIAARNTASGEVHQVSTTETGEFRFGGLTPGIYFLQNPTSPNTNGTAPAVSVSPSQTNNGLALQSDNSGTLQFQADTVSASKEATAVKREYTEEPIKELSQSNAISKDGEEHGAKNLSLLTETATPGSVVQSGTGPSIAGRPNTSNNFEINGVDNNNQAVPGALLTVSNEAVSNFTIVQGDRVSQISHSTGGQLNEIISQGSNMWHGSVYDYLNTRKLNAVEPSLPGNLRTQRYDQNRMGLSAGGPLKSNSLFAFLNLEYVPLRANRIQMAPILVPTEAGYAAAGSIFGLSAVHLAVLRNNVGVADQATSFTRINGVVIPVGAANTEERVSTDRFNGIANIDWHKGTTSKLSFRYGHNDYGTNAYGIALPAFQVPGHTRAIFGAVNYTAVMGSGMTFSGNAGYNRYDVSVGGGSSSFPFLAAFPNIQIQDLGLNLGSNVTAGRIRTNMYEGGIWADQAFGGHHIRVGADVRVLQSLIGNLGSDSGVLAYSSLGRFLMDQAPDAGAQQTFGGSTFNGGRTLLNAFVQDKMRYRGVDIDAGLSWQYSQLPESIRRQSSIGGLDIPGLIDFDRVRPDRLNLAPHVGIALSPGSEKTTIRAGFGMLFDALAGPNWFIGPETRVTVLPNTALVSTAGGFLGGGGLLAPTTTDGGINTFAFDQQLPYIEHWNAGISRAILGRLTAEVKYVGNHGVHQPLQTILNDPAAISAANSLPVFFTNPGLPVLNSLALSQQTLFTATNPYTLAGFSNPILAVRNDGSSWYNAGVVKLNERFSGGTQISAEYTYADSRSDATGTALDLLYGRRMEQSVWGRKHRATVTPVLDISYLTRNWTGRTRSLSSNLTITTTLTYERGARVPLFNGMETGFIGIPAGTGIFVNPNGIAGTSTGVIPLTNTSGQIVAYQAVDPTAQLVAGGPGSFSSDRPTFRMGDTRNIDMSIAKKFAIRHSMKLEARADAYNLFNHPQFTGLPIASLGNGLSNVPGFLMVANPQFSNMRGYASAHLRTIQLAVHVTF